MNPIAKQLNAVIETSNPHILQMLSDIGSHLFFPKGILSQSAEAKEKAHRINATIGIAKEKGKTMYFPSIMEAICDIPPEESLTYAPSFGIPGLRKAWQTALFEKNPTLSGKSISLPVVSAGITHGVSVFADMFVNPGDTVILPDMMWGNYTMILSVRKGAKISNYSTFSSSGGYNVAAFEEKVRAEAKIHSKIIVLLNFPHNPSGYSPSRTEAFEIVRILKEIAESGVNVVAVTDDSYFGLFYEEETLKESLFAHLCGIHPRLLAVKLDGATKEHFVWGLRVGFVTYGCKSNGSAELYDALEKKTAGAVRGSISNASHLSQSVILRSMKDAKNSGEKQEKFDILQRRAKRVKEVLAKPEYNAAWDVYPFNSGYFMCLCLKNVDAEKLRVHLLDNYGVGLISIGEKNLRVAFSCLDEEQIPELFDTILKGIKDISS